MMPEIVAADVSPSTAIISRPTEQTQVIASNSSSDKLPRFTAPLILTHGNKRAAESAHMDEAIRLPFFNQRR